MCALLQHACEIPCVGHLLSSSMEASADCGLEARLDQVKHLRIRIEELRAVISEQFAAQLSAACNVQ